MSCVGGQPNRGTKVETILCVIYETLKSNQAMSVFYLEPKQARTAIHAVNSPLHNPYGILGSMVRRTYRTILRKTKQVLLVCGTNLNPIPKKIAISCPTSSSARKPRLLFLVLLLFYLLFIALKLLHGRPKVNSNYTARM
jgi:hypothetical protein